MAELAAMPGANDAISGVLAAGARSHAGAATQAKAATKSDERVRILILYNGNPFGREMGALSERVTIAAGSSTLPGPESPAESPLPAGHIAVRVRCHR